MTQALVVQEDVGLQMAVSPELAKQRLVELQQFVKDVMVEGEDYGIIPGTVKPTLFQPGAQKLCEIYGLALSLEVTNRIEDWEKGRFHYEVKAVLVNKRNGIEVGQGLGSCNSMEGRYRWRDLKRTCPQCHGESIIKGRAEFGGGWLCFKKTGGCGAKYPDGDALIEKQVVGRIENDDVYTLVNTILKMAKKRAMVDVAISVTRSSGLFTQDLEDLQGHSAASDDFVDGEFSPVMPQGRRVGANPSRGAGAPRAAASVVTPSFDPAWRCPDHPNRTPVDGRCTMVLGKDKTCQRTANDVPPAPQDGPQTAEVHDRAHWLDAIANEAMGAGLDDPETLTAWLSARGLEDGTEEAFEALAAHRMNRETESEQGALV